MRHRTILVCAALAGLQAATVLDRMAVVVDKRVIKTSDIDRDLRVTEFLNRRPLDFSADARHKAAERLIEQAIIREQLARGGYARATDSSAAALLATIRRERFAGSEARLRAALSQYGLSEAQLEEQLQWQLTVLRYIDQRFRNGVLVTDEEVRQYYDAHRAQLAKENPQGASFEALQAKIRASLEGERVNQNFAEAMDAARKRSNVRYLQGAFQ